MAWFQAQHLNAREGGDGRVRAGILMPCLISGGAETWMLSLARTTDHTRINWQGAALIGANAPAAREAVASLRAEMPVVVGTEAARELADRCDVLISWALEDLRPILGPGPKKPKVVYCDHFPHVRPWTQAARWCIDQVDAVVGVSELCLPGVPPGFTKPYSVIWNCVEPDRVRRAIPRHDLRREWGIPADARVAGFVGRLSPEKRPEVMVDLAASLPEPWHVVLVGEGQLRAELAARADHPAGRVHVVGPIAEVGDALAAFDCLVSPSRLESFGLAIGEAMLAGVPVVSTPSGLETLAPGFTRPVPAEAAGGQIAAAIAADADDFVGTWDRVIRAREFVRTRLSPERFGREWSDLICAMVPSRNELAARIAACPHRGGVLPVSQQPDCDCRGKELSECRAGKGADPGRVTTADCVACVS